MPDYRCDILNERSKNDKNGNIIFDLGGGGKYHRRKKKVVGGGMFGSQSTKQLGLYWKVQNLPISIFCTITTPMELQSSTK